MTFEPASLTAGFCRRLAGAISLGLVASTTPAVAQDSGDVVEHTAPPPAAFGRMAPHEMVQGANAGLVMEWARDPAEELEDVRLLSAALAELAPQRPGTVDAYIVSVALDSDPVFAREAREAANVLSRRYDGAGRTIVLAGPNGRSGPPLARGSLRSLEIALARMAELADPQEDAVILYITSHGTPNGVFFHYGDQAYGGISPSRLQAIFAGLEIRNRLVIVNACFSGIFVSGLSSPDSAIVSASAAGLTSFGCDAGNDWTYFGDAFVNQALRMPAGLEDAFQTASRQVYEWEKTDNLMASQPQISIGANTARWLGPLEARMPQEAGEPVGRPARPDGR
ncbi:MAG: C13 family peptidase [Parasphingopyxis sp.]|uniref:C13 family peptidase n=1 Tax=Parasphingopyxis sp. TaxID=1920299 RepID=UPI0032EF886B